MTVMQDSIKYHTEWDIEKWSPEQVDAARHLTGGDEPSIDALRHLFDPELVHIDGNLLTTAGVTRITALLNAGGGNAITTTTARVGAGNGAGTAAVGDTDLSASAGSSNRWFNLCTVSVSAGVMTFVAVFASGDGNFAWNEFGIDIGTATVTAGATVNAVLLNHKTSIAAGTKASGAVWTATATLTLA